MTLEAAVEILNTRNHNGAEWWRASPDYVTCGYVTLRAFEAIAIAEKYARESKPPVRLGVDRDIFDAELAGESEAPTWTPITASQPSANGRYLVWRKTITFAEFAGPHIARWDGKVWWETGVTHWAELPEPPEGEVGRGHPPWMNGNQTVALDRRGNPVEEKR